MHRELIAFSGVPLTFLLCVVLRAYGVERPGSLFFVMMNNIIGVLITFITFFTMVWFWPDLRFIAGVFMVYLSNVILGKSIIG